MLASGRIKPGSLSSRPGHEIQRSSAHRRVPKTRLEPHVPRLNAPRLVSGSLANVHAQLWSPGSFTRPDRDSRGPVQQQLKPGALEPLPVSLSARVKSPRRLLDAGSFGAWEEST
jgi:hypothetical protein